MEALEIYLFPDTHLLDTILLFKFLTNLIIANIVFNEESHVLTSDETQILLHFN